MNPATRALRDLLVVALDDGGPTPIADALERWHELYTWQERRAIERTIAQAILRSLALLG